MLCSICLLSLFLGRVAALLSAEDVAAANKLKCNPYLIGTDEPKKTKKWKNCKGNDEKLEVCWEKGYKVTRKSLVDEEVIACEYIYSSDHTNIHTALLDTGREAILDKWRKKKAVYGEALEQLIEDTILDLAENSVESMEDMEEEFQQVEEERKMEIKGELSNVLSDMSISVVEFREEVSAKEEQYLLRYEDVLGYREIWGAAPPLF